MGFAKNEMIRAYEDGWHSSDKSVCAGCVDDPVLKAALDAAAQASQACSFCARSPAADLDVLLELFVAGLKTEYTDADNAGVGYDSREGGYQWDRTWDTGELVGEFEDVLTGEGLADAVTDAMVDQTWVEVGFAGPREDDALATSWERFCDMVKYKTRYVFWRRPDRGEHRESGVGEIPAALILDQIGAILDDERLDIVTQLPADSTFGGRGGISTRVTGRRSADRSWGPRPAIKRCRPTG